jgi:hypothetical protein
MARVYLPREVFSGRVQEGARSVAGMSRRAVVRKVATVGGVGLLFVGGVAQLVPYGWTRSNPPVTAEAPWPDAEAEAVARESCYSCHSNETDWPAYSYVAPMSWLVRRDVDRGRAALNFSEWGEESEPDDAAEEVEDGSMPPSQYTAVHRGARLTDEEARILVAALERMDDED